MCAGGRGTPSNPDDQGSGRLHTREARSTRMREPLCFYQMYCKRECNTQKHGEPDKEQS